MCICIIGLRVRVMLTEEVFETVYDMYVALISLYEKEKERVCKVQKACTAIYQRMEKN